MELRNFIDGKFIDSLSKKNIPVLNPANQKVVGNIDEALDEEIDLAFQAAKRALYKRILVDMDSKDKSNMMRAIAQKLRERKDEGGKLLSQENGKTIKQCVDEFKGAADTFDFYAGLTDKIENKLIPSGHDTLNYVVLEPFGVALQIVPWNYPVSIFSGMVAQNWIVGNTIVIKPPELCPISSNFYGQIFKDVGVPDGIINIVHGYGETTGRKLVQHPGSDYIVFTGSPEVASEILKETADRIIPTHFESGGKSAAIIYPDADIDKAVDSTVKGIFKPNAGQICVAMSRVIVDPKIKDEALGDQDRTTLLEFIKQLNKFCVGLDELWCQGPLFDYAILQNLYAQLNTPVPWNYWQIRDSRTLFGMLPEDPRKSIQMDLHNALADCYFQAKSVQKAYKRFGVKKR